MDKVYGKMKDLSLRYIRDFIFYRIIQCFKKIRFIDPLTLILLIPLLISGAVFLNSVDTSYIPKLFDLFSCNNIEVLKNIPLIINKDPLKIHLIDCGQGDAVFITAYGKNILIDTGPEDQYEKVRKYISAITSEIDILIVTHDHDDHTGLLKSISDNFRIKKILLPQSSKNMLQKFDVNEPEAEISCHEIGSEMGIKDITIRCMHPGRRIYDDENNNSGVYLITFKGMGYLFTGDADKEIISDVFRNMEVPVVLFKAGHHGSSTSFDGSMERYVETAVTLISCGFRNMFNHPSKDLIRILEEGNHIYYRTDLNGTVLITSDGKRLKTAPFHNLK